MLDEFKDKQSMFYDEIQHSISNNKISHAYLIETNDYPESDKLLIDFVKTLFSVYIDKDNIDNVSNLIDINAYSDFIIVEPEGSWIKKEQILEVKEKFKMTSFQNSPRIYLIKNADCLNKYAANSLLKFLEEPEGNIIAILETSNRYKVLETVRSRCQVYSLLNTDNNIVFNDETILNGIIELLEKRGVRTIAYLSNFLENDLRDKDFWQNIFNEMIEIYVSSLRKKENVEHKEYGFIQDLIIENNSSNEIINKIDVLFINKNNLDYNLGLNMMLDKFIIEFTGGE